MRSGPILIAYDGSPAAAAALREAAGVLAPRRAVVVAVWKEGIALEAVVDSATRLPDVPPADVDVRTATEVEQEVADRARHLAEHGAALALEAGFAEAQSLAVAEEVEVPISETLVDLANARDAPAIVLGAHGHGGALGPITRDVIRHASCPVVVGGAK